MKKSLKILLGIILGVTPVFAQNTTVSGAVTDSDSQAWVGGKITFNLYNPSGTQRPVYCATGLPVTTNVSATLAGGGSYSASVADNSKVCPNGTRWIATVVPNAFSGSYTTAPINVEGSSKTITFSGIPAPRFVGSQTYGYTTDENSQPIHGDIFYNVISNTNFQWDGTTWVEFVTSDSILRVDTFPGSDTSIKVNACITAAISLGGGICDARKLDGTNAMSQPIVIGNSSSVPVSLLLPASGVWQWSTSISGCAVTVYNRSSLIGYGNSGEGIGFTFEGISGFNGEAIVCTIGLTGDSDTASDSYFRLGNFTSEIVTGATVTNSVTLLRNAADSSDFQAIETVPDGAGASIGLLAKYDCCGTTLTRVGADSFGSTTSTIPCQISASVNVIGGSCVHATIGNPDLLVDNGTGDGSPSFLGMYFENFGANTSPQIEVKGGNGSATTIINAHCLAASGQYCLQIDTGSATVTAINLHSTTSPAINDQVNGVSVPIGGAIPWYSTAQNFVSAGWQYQNKKDATLTYLLDSGNTAGQITTFVFGDRGTSEWNFLKTANNNTFEISDNVSGLARFESVRTSHTYIDSDGPGSVQLNMLPNSGSGGLMVGNGGSSPSLVFKVDNSGNTYAANGTNIVYRCITAGTLPIGALTITAADCGTTSDTGIRVK